MEPTIWLLCLAAFIAGFIDSIAGGGGLIQMPIGLMLLPNLPVSTVIGTLKIPSFAGTFFAAIQYVKTIKVDWRFAAAIGILAMIASFGGSYLLTLVSNIYLKPILLLVLIFVAIYTFVKKDFGAQKSENLNAKKYIFYGIFISVLIGFYDGFIGPGAGSFFILAFIALLKFDFLKASTYSKIINLFTNLGSILLFLLKGKIIWSIALPMAVSNSIGAYFGAKFAILKGNKFIKNIFLLVIIIVLIRFAFDVWKQFYSTV
jgi:uncharacterized protein